MDVTGGGVPDGIAAGGLLSTVADMSIFHGALGSVSISSADGLRQLSIFKAYPPQPVSSQPSALALEMTGVAQVALNSGCRFQFR